MYNIISKTAPKTLISNKVRELLALVIKEILITKIIKVSNDRIKNRLIWKK